MNFVLTEAVGRYLEYRTALGCGMVSDRQILHTFCRFIGAETHLNEVEPERVLAFLHGTGPVTRYWQRKHQALNGFYRFAMARSYVSTSPLPVECPPRPASKPPYIFTRQELIHLLQCTDSFPNRKNTLARYCFRTLLLLLYATGLRISEALGLTRADTDLSAGVLTIRETKFHKSRLVPFAPELKDALLRYSRQRSQSICCPENAPFFLNRDGVAPTRQQVERAFGRLRAHAGIRRSDQLPHSPRIHDLRHTFAVHRLVSWYRQGADVQKLLPQLATYLGHVDITSTQWYLTMTPELLSQANKRFERYALGVTNG